MNFLLAGIGASLGAILRYFITNYGKKHWERIQKYYLNLPIPTLVINLSGAFLLGLIFSLKANIFVYAFVGTGVMGGYTTFSTLNTELVGLYHERNFRGFWGYLIVSYLGGLLLVYLGFLLGSVL